MIEIAVKELKNRQQTIAAQIQSLQAEAGKLEKALSVLAELSDVVTGQPTAANTNRSGSATTTIRPRTHTVASGETAVGIARKYGVKLGALQAANPGMNSTHIRVGQVLNIPPK